MFATSKTIAPDSLISLISEEYERQKTQKLRRSGKTKEDDKDEAMAVGSSSGKERGSPDIPVGYAGIVVKKGIIRISALTRPLINLPKIPKRKAYQRN